MTAVSGLAEAPAQAMEGRPARPAWDMSSPSARFRSFFSICSPATLRFSSEEVLKARALLDAPPPGCGEPELAAALQLVDSSMHPETRELVPLLFRRSAFTLFNTPLFFGIAATPQTAPWVVGWQVCRPRLAPVVRIAPPRRSAVRARTKTRPRLHASTWRRCSTSPTARS